jgi:hypothetical protein
MIRLDSQRMASGFERHRDEETEIEPLGACVAPGAKTHAGGAGQTLVTFVENESTDDE